VGQGALPAKRYGLLIYSHANGQTMCPDEQSHHDMGIAELTDVVSEQQSVDFLALELCNMAGIEIAYQWRPGNGGFSANVLVAIPNAGRRSTGIAPSPAFARPGHATKAEGPCLDPAIMTEEDFGRLVIEEGENGRRETAKRRPERAGHEAAACYDLHAAEDVKHAVDAFAVALAKGKGQGRPLRAARSRRSPGRDELHGRRARPARLRRSLRSLPRAAECERLDTASRAAARQVMEEVDQFVIASFGMSAYEGFSPGQNGVFLMFPDGDLEGKGAFGSTRLWSQCTWYTPGKGRGSNEYGHWAWCKDGATESNGVVENWFELLDSWFDQGDGGGANNCRP
jgi:clostripain